MDTRNRNSAILRGAVTLQMLVILAPVLFAFMGFAVDLGRLYMVRGELKAAADSMALAAAARLTGTDAALDEARTAAQRAVTEAGGQANRYDYGGLEIGQTTGRLASTIDEPSFFDTFEAAAGDGAGAAGGTTARHVRVSLTADAPLVFWGFLQLAQNRATAVRVASLAGISAPLCAACGIDGLAVAALDAGDAANFGFVPASRYTLGYVCTGPGTPGALAGTVQRIPYLLINRLNEEAEILADESTQTFRMGAGGLPASTSEARSCVLVDGVEQVWAAAAPLTCPANQPPQVPGAVTAYVCGLNTRLEAAVNEACANVPDIGDATAPFLPDTDLEDVEEYAAYAGNLRRVLTIPIVDSLANNQAMTVLGFRQFLLQPLPNVGTLQPNDNNARFIATYLGNPVPLRQGRFSGCSIANGPGKVVLHQ